MQRFTVTIDFEEPEIGEIQLRDGIENGIAGPTIAHDEIAVQRVESKASTLEVERSEKISHVLIELPDAEQTSRVTANILVDTEVKIGNQPASVNWSSIGSVTPGDARLYAQAILAAADEAEARCITRDGEGR